MAWWNRGSAAVVMALLGTGCFAASDSAGDDGASGAAFDDGAGDGGGDGPFSSTGATPPGDDGADGDDGAAGDEGGDDGGGGASQDPGQLSAGEWRDLDHWDFWLGLMNGSWASMADHWQIFTSERIAVLVMQDDVAVGDAHVVLTDVQGEAIWHARTDAHGHAELFVGLFGEEASGPWSVQVTSGGSEVLVEQVAPTVDDPVLVQIPEPAAPASVLDLMFVIDTTGSMGDELSYLQAELADVIERVQSEAEQAFALRLSVNFYRDVNDQYVVRSFPFTEDIPVALEQLSAQSAGGGGDFPEAVEEALTNAIFDHQWSDSARARLLFLVLDAPPHHDTARLAEIQEATREAARQGIRLIPLVASGIDKDTEFLMRMIDIATGGTYVFLTDHSGIGNPHLEPTIGEYQVELLNALLVRVIGHALAL